MTALEKLKNAKSLTDVAKMLGFTPSGLSYILYRMPPATRYTTFTIPKKGGGVRTIDAPTAQLKLAQRRLANILYQCRATIEAGTPRRPLSHGFRRSLSIITNAKPHQARRYVLNLDLQDFFPSFNFGRVRGFFIRNRDFALHEKVATIIAQIACHENALPQGSPCSPVIADLIAHVLDVRLAALAKTSSATYSRYADDLSFSSGRKQFASALAHRDEQTEGSPWHLGLPLVTAIEDAGFRINHGKTRMQCRPRRQMVTGLTVNAKVNIPADYYRLARSACNELFRTGTYHRQKPILLSDGTQSFERIHSPAVLEGVLNHIYHVKSVSDSRAEKERKEQRTAPTKLYRKFLFFRHFVALERPLVICEGRTDNIYLKTALRRLSAFHPRLGAWSGAHFQSEISFLRYSDRVREVLDLTGGTGDLATFMVRYSQSVMLYSYRPLNYPVILLIDNDDGANKIFSLMKQKGTPITFTSDGAFYHWQHNLYIVKTPSLGSSGVSCIESFFDPTVLDTKLKGKSFQPKAPIDKAKEYGKAAFAENVILPNAGTIDFSQFAGIFDRIIAVLDDYKAPIAP